MYHNNPFVGLAPLDNSVKQYEIRVLDGDRTVVRTCPLNAISDEEAIDIAYLVSGAAFMQIWQLARLVFEIDAR